jgi:hypothetical protein
MLKSIRDLSISPHIGRLMQMYLSIARYSVRPMWPVLGGPSSPGRIDQFTRDGHGTWLSPIPRPPAQSGYRRRLATPLIDTLFTRISLEKTEP